MARCEDYPCCGHTDGLECDYDTSYYSSQEYHNYLNLHYGCDHEAGWCAAYRHPADEGDVCQNGTPIKFCTAECCPDVWADMGEV